MDAFGAGSSPMRPGAIIGADFKIIRPLSAGGMGSVFVAEQLSTGRQRAVKLMHPSLVTDARMRERFVQEARISATIESDHVVEVVAAGVDAASGAPFLAMELLTGEDLAQYLTRRGALSPDEAREILAQLCHGVGAAHARGIVHRDLKPDNVFLARSRRLGVDVHVKILDFGIAKSLGGLTSQATQSMGTPLWMAPEQSDSRGRVSPATDVWAIGLIAFRALTGAYYWNAAVDSDSSVHALMREIILDDLDAPTVRLARRGARATVPAGFDAWFARCVVREPAQRFANATDAFAALRPLLGGEQGTPPSLGGLAATDEWIDAELVVDDGLVAARLRFDAAPRRADAARAILALARESGERDLAYRAASLLAAFKSASPDEETIARDPSFARPPIARAMDDGAWLELLHPSISRPLVDVLAGVAPALSRASGATARPPDLDGAALVERNAAGASPVATVVYSAAALLGVPIPRVFVRPSGTLPLTMVHGEPPICVASAAFFAILSPPQALFVAARSLARLRPELYAAHFYGTPENLRALVTGAAHAVGRGGPPGAGSAAITAMLQQHLTHAERAALARCVERLLSLQSTADLGRAIRGAQSTAARAGLLLAGDLKLALRELTRTPPPSAIITVDEVVDDLLRFWLGEPCSSLRRRLGT